MEPVLPLIPEKIADREQEKHKYIVLELKMKAMGGRNTATYKKYVRKFNEGTPQEWIEFMEDLDEVWNQNSVTQLKDKAVVI